MKKIIKKNIDKCLRHSRFFGDYYEHDFAYKNKEERVCLRCGKREMFFGYAENGEGEDWRRKL